VAVRLAPRQPGLHEELGDQDWIVGHLDKAAEAYREELSIDPNAVTAKYKLGSLLVENQNAAEGVELLRSALHQDSTLSDAHYYLGIGLMGTGQDEDATAEFKQAIAADPGNDRAMTSWYKLAQVYRKLHNTTEAQAALQNFQRMRAEVKERQDSKTAQLVRKRTELPVENKDAAALTAEP
jgi:tetratricopeptide (TPR) repeat protein